MDPLCGLKIKFEAGEVEYQHSNGDAQNVVSNIRKEENDEAEQYTIDGVSAKIESNFEKKFIDISYIKNEKYTEASGSGSTFMISEPICVNDSEDETDPLAEKVKSSKNEINRWKTYPWLCSFCGQWPFLGYECLHEHLQAKHKDADKNDFNYTCNDCEKTFFIYSVFLNHVRITHHAECKLCCDICDQRFEDFEQLSNHRNFHINLKETVHPDVYFCFKCGRGYPQKHELNSHIRFSHSYICQNCKMVFPSRLELEQHDQKSHRFVCDVCGTAFIDPTALKQHIKIHRRVLVCEFCKETFSTEQSLTSHVMSHLMPVKHKSDFCKKEFRTKIEKLSHEYTHGERAEQTNRNQCEFCKELFKTPHALKAHLKSHYTPVKFKCDLCEKVFSKKVDKILHERTHEQKEENPICFRCRQILATEKKLKNKEPSRHKCSACPKSFKFLIGLIRHKEKHKECQTNTCKICKKQF